MHLYVKGHKCDFGYMFGFMFSDLLEKAHCWKYFTIRFPHLHQNQILHVEILKDMTTCLEDMDIQESFHQKPRRSAMVYDRISTLIKVQQ